ncbi:MAG: hypothetical protein ABIK08_08120 [Pseudomonadota bacterium]
MNHVESGTVHQHLRPIFHSDVLVLHHNLFDETREESPELDRVAATHHDVAQHFGGLGDFAFVDADRRIHLILNLDQLRLQSVALALQGTHALGQVGQVGGVLAVQLEDAVQVVQALFGVAQIGGDGVAAAGPVFDPFPGELVEFTHEFDQAFLGQNAVHDLGHHPFVEVSGGDAAVGASGALLGRHAIVVAVASAIAARALGRHRGAARTAQHSREDKPAFCRAIPLNRGTLSE